MSCGCSVCTYTIAQPDSIWYAACKNSIFASYVCGTCLAEIPPEARVPTPEQLPNRLTFGPFAAQVNEGGIYQCSSLKQMEPRFWVPFEVLDRHWDRHCELMRDQFPLLATDRFVRELVQSMREGRDVPAPWEGKSSRHDLVMAHSYGLEEFLGLDHPPRLWDGGEKIRIRVYTPENPAPPPSPAELHRVEVILQGAIQWCEGGAS